MDAVTSLGGSPLKVDDWGIDAIYSASQKCLSCTPGLSPVSLERACRGEIKNRKTPVTSWFFDINLVMCYWGDGKRTYHHTAPINPLYGLHEALVMLTEEGWKMPGRATASIIWRCAPASRPWACGFWCARMRVCRN